MDAIIKVPDTPNRHKTRIVQSCLRGKKMVERIVFINGIPALCEALTKAGREDEAKNLVKNFLNRTFSLDIDKKVERFRSLPTGIFLADTPYFRIFWEFNQLYIAGLYYTTVVTAGVLCERICLDVLEKNKTKPKKEFMPRQTDRTYRKK